MFSGGGTSVGSGTSLGGTLVLTWLIASGGGVASMGDGGKAKVLLQLEQKGGTIGAPILLRAFFKGSEVNRVLIPFVVSVNHKGGTESCGSSLGCEVFLCKNNGQKVCGNFWN